LSRGLFLAKLSLVCSLALPLKQGFCQAGPWWDVCAAALAAPADAQADPAAARRAEQKAKRLRRTLREQLEESHQLLSVGLQHRHSLDPRQYRPLLDFSFFAALAGAIELSVVPITFESPLTRYCKALAAAPRCDQTSAIKALVPIVEAAAQRAGVGLDAQGEVARGMKPPAARRGADSSDEDEEDDEDDADADADADGGRSGGAKRACLTSLRDASAGAMPAAAADGHAQPEGDAAHAAAAGGTGLGQGSAGGDVAPPSAVSGIRWGDAPERVVACLATLAPAIFGDVEGVALGLMSSALNHSCLPNCQFDTAPGGALALVPLCDVAAGDELLVAYTATAAPLATRRAELRKHRFVCDCARCAFDAAAAGGPQALAAAVAAMPAATVLALSRQAQEEGRYEDAELLLSALLARPSGGADAGVAEGEAAHALGVSQLAQGRWSEAHATWATAARAAPQHPALTAQVAKDGSYWPAPTAPHALVARKASGALAFSRVLLGDDGAVAVATTAPLLDCDDCARVVAAAEAAAAAMGGWTTARHYAVPTTDLPLHKIPALLQWFNDAMRSSIALLLAAAYPGVVRASRVRVHDAFVVRYSAAAQRHLPVHRDQSMFSLTIALNSRAEFEGGGTYFADARTVVCPDVGGVVCFSGETRHGGEPITSGVRYIIAAFLYLADEDGPAGRDDA